MNPATQQFLARLEDYLSQQQEIWQTFAYNYDKKSRVVSSLIDLGFSMSSGQVAQMEQGEGIPVQGLTDEQKSLLSQVEPLMSELGFLAYIGKRTLEQSMIRFFANGYLEFRWIEPPDHQVGSGINWLPYSLCGYDCQKSFAEAQAAWMDRREWLVRQHYADFRQAADCSRLLFLIALSLSSDQIEAMIEKEISIKEIRPDQNALLQAASNLWPGQHPDDLDACSIRFETHGQFWLIRKAAGRDATFGQGWLPYSLKKKLQV